MEKNSWIVVITTLITVGGTVAVAIINRGPAKADKVVEDPVKPVPAPEPVPAPRPVEPEPEKPVPVPTPDKPRETPAPAPVAEPTVAGAWHDAMHRDYRIVVNGSVAQLTGPEFPVGMMAMVAGTNIQWNFTQPNGNQGTCGGAVTGDQLNIMCKSLAGSMPFFLHRPGS